MILIATEVPLRCTVIVKDDNRRVKYVFLHFTVLECHTDLVEEMSGCI